MSLKIAIGTSTFAAGDNKPLKMLRDAGVEIIPNPYGRKLTEAEIMLHLKDADGLIAGLEPLNRRVLSTAPSLKAIARVGIGMDNVDLEAAADLGIKVSNTPDGPTKAVAELTVACMICLCRQLPQMNEQMHAGRWTKLISKGLINTPILIIGYGRIGKAVGKLLKPFGAEIMVCDPIITTDDLAYGETLVYLDDGLAQAQIITLHAGGNTEILNQDAFQKMQSGVILINAARAELVNEPALIEALSGGKVSGAWFDVFWQEPYQGELIRFPNVLLTPHVGTYTGQCRLRMESEAVNNILRDLGART